MRSFRRVSFCLILPACSMVCQVESYACLSKETGVRFESSNNEPLVDTAGRSRDPSSPIARRGAMDYKDKQASSPSTVIAVPGTHPPGTGRLVVMSNRAPIRVVRENGKQRIEPTV